VHLLEGKFEGRGKKVAIAASRFNDLVTGHLIEGARDALLRHGVAEADLTLVRVPGAFELPLIAGKLARSGRYQAVVALGAVIRGSTPHFDYVAAEVSKGLASESLSSGVPIAFGVLTTDTIEQALERAGLKAGNKGWDAAMTVLELMDLIPQLD
jgi:6,7-dimethyl-8-ribityllumazine synthase